MFLNINGTVQKKLRKVGDKTYKVANQCLYPCNEPSPIVYDLELHRGYGTRLKLTSKAGEVQVGYIRHVIIDGERFPRIFFRKNSQEGHQINFPLAKIEPSNKYYHLHLESRA